MIRIFVSVLFLFYCSSADRFIGLLAVNLVQITYSVFSVTLEHFQCTKLH